MKVFDEVEKLEKLCKLIVQRKTGKASELAECLGISRRQLFHYLESLRHRGAKISYDRGINSYKLMDGQSLEVNFSFRLRKREV